MLKKWAGLMEIKNKCLAAQESPLLTHSAACDADAGLEYRGHVLLEVHGGDRRLAQSDWRGVGLYVCVWLCVC